MKPHIDYSQYKDFTFCEAKWFERVCQKVQKARKEGQQDGALALGSLVHAMLESLRTNGTIEVSNEVVGEINPTPECFQWARALMLGYQQTYPNETFTHYYLEEPLRFPVHYAMDGLAKIDSYFHISEAREIESGLGDTFSLQPGWWIKEYKTKDVSRDRGNYIASWRVNMQANFQILALQEKLGEQVQGLFVDVLEKPKPYIPKRTCKGCKGQYELRDWRATGEGYACPICAHIQDLAPYKPKVEGGPKPSYYRLAVVRSREEVEVAKNEIAFVANRMCELLMPKQEMLAWPALRATERCVDGIFGPCEYFAPHSEGVPAKGHPGFVEIEPFSYIKEPNVFIKE